MVAQAQRTRRDATSQPRSHYTNNKELGDLIDAWKHARNRLARPKQERLIVVLMQIAGGVWDRYEFTAHRDDFVQDVIHIYFEKALRSIDTSRNCFAYLTTCAVNFGMRTRNRQIRDRRAEHSYGVERLTRHFSEC